MFGDDVAIDVEQHPDSYVTSVKISIVPAEQSERENANSYDKISENMYTLSEKIKIQKKKKE